jgi:hypothetical protein
LISTKRPGFWQALRDPEAVLCQDIQRAIETRGRITVAVLYGDHEGGHPAVAADGEVTLPKRLLMPPIERRRASRCESRSAAIDAATWQADMTASSDSSSYWVRSSIGQAVRSAHSCASSNGLRSSAARKVVSRDGVSSRLAENRFIGVVYPSAEAEDNPKTRTRNSPEFLASDSAHTVER